MRNKKNRKVSYPKKDTPIKLKESKVSEGTIFSINIQNQGTPLLLCSADKESTTSPSSEVLTAMLTEYSELRQEIRNAQSKQTGMISLYITILSAIFAAAAQLYSSGQGDGASALSPELIAIVFIGILPMATEFMGVIYLDQVYRQVKLGVYIYHVENRINTAYPNNNRPTMNWERWAQEQEDERFLKKANNYNYYVSFALFLIAEWISIFFGLVMLSFHLHLYVLVGLGVALAGYISLLLFFKGYKRQFDKLMKLIPTYKSKKASNYDNYYTSCIFFLTAEWISIFSALFMYSFKFHSSALIGIGISLIEYIGLLLIFREYRRKSNTLLKFIPAYNNKKKSEKTKAKPSNNALI